MKKQDGVVLTDVWDTIKGEQKVRILDQVVDMEKRLATTGFSKFGSLYYKNDLPENPDPTSPLYINSVGKEVWSKTFGIEPTNHRSFFDTGRGELDIDRGPCKFISSSFDPHVLIYAQHLGSTATEFMEAIARREILYGSRRTAERKGTS